MLKFARELLPQNGRLHSTAISGQIILILMLDQYSQRRKMRLEQEHLKKFKANLYKSS